LQGGGDKHSVGLGLSDDGSVVVGYSNSASGLQAFRWTLGGGMQGLGDLRDVGPFGSGAYGVNADGSTIVGRAFGSKYEAVRWTSAGGIRSLGGNDGDSIAFDVTADGSMIVGWTGQAYPDVQAFRWTSSGGMQGLGDLAGGAFQSVARAVNSDGSVIVGDGRSASGKEAFRWTSAGGMQGLGDLPGGIFDSDATAVSADGSVVVGASDSGLGWEAFRWTSAGGMQGLGHLPDGPGSYAQGVSGDGAIVVGVNSDGHSYEKPFIWDATHGMRNLQQVLIDDFGLDLSGWTLTSAHAISADGRTIAGTGTHLGRTEAWIATIPEPSSVALLGLGGVLLLLLRRAATLARARKRIA
jgi:probable HAF family extracellular repeat protein